jgi:glycosyltransferase involved in cell wall biosynthesis
MNSINKKVLFLTNIPSPYRVEYFNQLGKLCDLTVLFERRSSDERDARWHNNSFINFNAVFLKGIKKGPNKAFCPEVIKYLNRQIYDVIVVGGYATPTGMLAISYLRHKKIPFILNTDGGIINTKDSLVKNRIKRYFISGAEYWLSTGKETSSYLEYYGANLARTFIYPFTTLLQKDILEKPYNNEEKKRLKNKLNIPEEKIILSVGQFIHRKGIDVLLKACSSIPENCGVYIVGGEPNEEYLNIKRRLNLTNVHFVDFLTKEQLREYYKVSDVFVLPTREDIWGLVINEAMAYGLPVITTDKCVAGLELIKDYENGFIIPINNHQLLSEKINELLENDNIHKKMSIKSLEKIKLYTLENMAYETKQIFERVCTENEKRNRYNAK